MNYHEYYEKRKKILLRGEVMGSEMVRLRWQWLGILHITYPSQK